MVRGQETSAAPRFLALDRSPLPLRVALLILRLPSSIMFKSSNPYEEVVAKATDGALTEVDWGVYLTVWDKVNEDGEPG